MKLLKKETASVRGQAVKKAVESLEGKLEAVYFALGEHDVVGIVDLPDIASIAALSLAVSATGLVRIKSTALLSVEEFNRAIKKKIDYRAPGA